MGLGEAESSSQLCSGKGLKFVKTASLSGSKFCSDIPEWLLIEVLIRLPVKLVFKCKLVCKQWLYVITDPSFVRMYISRVSLSPQMQNWTFVYCNMHVYGNPFYELLEDAYSHDLKCPSFSMLRCPYITYPRMRYCMIVGVSNGLVLYVPSTMVGQYQIYNIYNPITRQWISLPPYVRYFERQQSSLVTRVENGVLSCYRVVRLEFRMERTNVIKFDVFVSEINEWKGFDVHTDVAFEGIWCGQPAAELNGILHWLTKGQGIMTYDSYQNPDSVRFIALPRDSDPTCHEHILNLCDAHLGSLRYFEVCETSDPPHGFSSFSVWILIDYSTGDWCLQHRIRSTAIIYDDVLSGKYLVPIPIYFHPFDLDIVFLRYEDNIMAYNFKTRKLEARNTDLGGGMTPPPWFWSIFLLVVPPWPLSINL